MFGITLHAQKQASTKGIDPRAIFEAAMHPTVTYSSRRYPGQVRHIRGEVCVIVDPARRMIVTVYAHKVETRLRVDQMHNRDALRHARRAGTLAHA